MQVKGMIMVTIIMLFVVVVAWIAVSVFDSVNNVSLNPNAEFYRRRIAPTFNTENLVKVDERVDELDVEPSIFHKLEDEGIEGLDIKTD